MRHHPTAPSTAEARRGLLLLTSLLLAASIAAPAAAQPASEQGYDAVVDALDAARDAVVDGGFFAPLGPGGPQIPVPGTDPFSVDRAQGLRYMLRLIETNLADQTDDRDVVAPTVDRCPSKNCKFGFDNPDTSYMVVGPMNGALAYEIFGNRGSVQYITYQNFIQTTGAFVTGSIFETKDLVTDEDGNYVIYLSATNDVGADNFMEIPAGQSISRIVVRQLTNDWNDEVESSIGVRVVGSPPTSAPIFGNLDMFIGGQALSFVHAFQSLAFRSNILNQLAENQFAPPAPGNPAGGGFPTNYTTRMRYALSSPTEVVVIESENTPLPVANYRNIQLSNQWGESLDYASRPVSYNGFQSHLGSDNVYRWIISQTDPGVANWLDATGHPVGGAFMRWQTPLPGDEPGTPTVTVLDIADLPDFLPADHPTVTPAERQQQIAARLQGYNRRKNPANFESFRDNDGDGEHNTGDGCADTPEGEVIDGDGCSRQQFCAQVDTSAHLGWARCFASDFLNDEPLRRFPKDCKVEYRTFACVAR